MKAEVTKVCPVCGTEFKTTYSQKKYCSTECYKTAKKQLCELNRDERLEYQKRYYITHKEQIVKRKKEYYKNHKDQYKKRQDEYYKTHKDQKLEYSKNYYRLCKKHGVSNLGEIFNPPQLPKLPQCPYDSDCFNCPEPDCILDYEEM